MERQHPYSPSRIARKLILPRAYSATGGLIPRSPAHQKPERSGVGPERALEANTQPHRAQRESSSFPEPTQRAEARCRGAHKNRSGAVSGRSEPWRRTPNPLAPSAKAPPPQSLLSERRPDTAERSPPKTRAERCRARASLGGEHPTPSRKARKLILPRAYSATGGLIPRSPAYQKPSGAVSGRSEPWRRTPQPPRAKRESSSFPEPTQRPEARCRVAPPTKNRSGAVSGRSEPWRRTTQPPRAQRES